MENSKRPYVICHMMSTIDGKITSGTGVDILEDYFGLYTQIEDKLGAQAWMIGRVTMQMFTEGIHTPLQSNNKKIKNDEDFRASHETGAYMFAVDTKGILRWKNNTISLSNVSGKLHLILIVTNNTPKEYLSYLQSKHISYLLSGKSEVDFNLVLRKMKEKFSVDKLLLEGGGILNGSVMASGLIDEISLLVTPKVANRNGAPSIFQQDTPKLDIKDYTLFDVEKMEKDCVWLRYKKSSK